MASFKKYYISIYHKFGYPLGGRSGVSPAVLAAAEKRLGVKAPAALRDYYLVAGNERRFNTCLNRLLAPGDWGVDKRRLIFMEENQSVLWWGVSTRNTGSDDPPVSQGYDDEQIIWYPEHRKCSVFLAVLLHHHAVSGGFRFCGSADAPDRTGYRFEENGWTWYGEVKSLIAYSRPNQVVCLTPPGELPFMRKWSVNAGAMPRYGRCTM